ncbi:MAG TPA: GNAT family N-acetyltransferase [Spirochaetota bacterium]|nr:GNAT family N-acetyltransferase [Spirochaetota bacterium]HPI23780.1 GNAT family N-acetyltransferase [Spirochaetota bacterium]HPU89898.1 GNAT family N-acetyltransferase [Spirochaetota bacterium]
MNDEYRFRTAQSPDDAEKLKNHFDGIFLPEKVGEVAVALYHHRPGMGPENWFIIEEATTGAIASACTLIPWVWEFEGVRLDVAEMGLVGTAAPHRGRGLMNELARRFAEEMNRRGCDLGGIEGIPGFYARYGYHYAVPLENHINLPLHTCSGMEAGAYALRTATRDDIPFLMAQDDEYRRAYSLSSVRDAASWDYIFGPSVDTECARDIRIIERDGAPLFSFAMMAYGFGAGLIVCEVSEGITCEALCAMLRFLGEEAARRGKPYVRFNLHVDSSPARMLIALGAAVNPGWAWQVRVPHPERFLAKIAPALDRRLAGSPFRESTMAFGVNLYCARYRLALANGRIKSVERDAGECAHAINVSADLFPALALGAHGWRELNRVRPEVCASSDMAGLLADALFPPRRSWMRLAY